MPLDVSTADKSIETTTVEQSGIFLFAASSIEALLAGPTAMREILVAAPDTSLTQLSEKFPATPAPQGNLRLAIVAKTPEKLLAKIDAILTEFRTKGELKKSVRTGAFFSDTVISGKIAFLYPTQGVQFPNMLLDIQDSFPAVATWYETLNRAYAGATMTPPVEKLTVATTLSESEYATAREQLLRSDTTQGTLVAASLALSEILNSLGIHADLVGGQSTGELTALIAGGCLQAQNAAGFQKFFHELQKRVVALDLSGAVPAGVAVVVSGLDQEQVEKIVRTLNSSVRLSLVNCPNQMILFGFHKDMQEAIECFQSMGAVSQVLPFHQVFHNEHFRAAAAIYKDTYEEFGLQTPTIPIYSSLNGEPYPEEPDAISMLAAKQWYSCVELPKAVHAMYRDGARIFIDVGPGNSLAAFARDILREKNDILVSAASSDRISGLEALLQLAASMFVAGRSVNLAPLTAAPAPSAAPITTSVTAPRIVEQPALPVQQPPLHNHAENEFRNQWPLLGEIIEHNEKSLLARRVLTLEQDCFLKDHTLTRELSRHRTDLLPLSVVPFTCSAEMICEAAAYFLQRRLLNPVVRRLVDVRGHRWVSLDATTAEVLIEATLVPTESHEEQSVAVKLHQRNATAVGGKVLLFEGTVVLGQSYPAAPTAKPFDRNDQLPRAFDPDILYNTGIPHPDIDVAERMPGFFLGPSFRPMKEILSCNTKGIECALEILPRDRLFRGVTKPRFQIDPVLADALGQILGLAPREQMGRNYDYFPFHVERLELFAPPPAVGMRCVGRAEVSFTKLGAPDTRVEPSLQIFASNGDIIDEAPVTEAHRLPNYRERARIRLTPDHIALSGNLEVLDENGTVIMRASGWHDRPMGLSMRFGMVRQYPQYELLSEPVSLPDQVSCRLLDFADESIWGESGGVWKRNMAHMTLVESERRQWYSLPENSAEQLEWLLIRIAVKDAARQWALDTLGLRLSGIDIELRPLANDRFAVVSRIQQHISFPTVAYRCVAGVVLSCCASTAHVPGIALQLLQVSDSEEHAITTAVIAAASASRTDAAEPFVVKSIARDTGHALVSNGTNFLNCAFTVHNDFVIAISNSEEFEKLHAC